MYGNRYDNRHSGGNYEETTVYPMEEEGDGCAICLKYLIIIFNAVFFLAGLGVCAGCIFILIDKTFVSDIIGNELLTVACWLCILGSGFTIFISVCGCCGASKSNRRMLLIYGGCLIGIALMMIAGGVIALIMRGEIGEWIIAEMEETLKDDYGVNQDNKYNQVITQAWDRGQDYMYCCAVRDQSWGVYRQSLWYADQPGIENFSFVKWRANRTILVIDKPYVPQSCCKKDLYDEVLDLRKCQTFNEGPPFLQSGMYNEAVHYRGCYTAGEEWVDYYSAWLAGLGIGVGLLLVLGIFSSLWLAVRLRKRY